MTREPNRDMELVAADPGETAAEPGVSAVADLEKCNPEEGEPVPREWSLEKQVNDDIGQGWGLLNGGKHG